MKCVNIKQEKNIIDVTAFIASLLFAVHPIHTGTAFNLQDLRP